MPTILAKVGVIKELKLLENKSNLNNGTNGGTMPTILAKVGVKEMQESKSNLAFTILQGWLRPISLQGVGN
jgi:hypothetical protein